MADSTETQNQKRSFTEQSDILIDVKGILLNVEGATAPLTFVRDELFSYAKKNVGAFVEAHWSDEELKGFIDTLREQAEKDQADGVQGVVVVPGKDADAAEIKKAVISNVLWQLGQGRQANLSTLLVQIWKEAYDSGELIGEVYEDVLPALEEWKELGKKIYGYTSGGVEAAKLLFAHTSDGDLSDMLSGYFDSTAGPKTDKESYVKIAEHLGTDASQVIYLTDIPAEAAAATAAGLKTCLVMREGNVTLSEEEQRTYQAVESFYELMKEDIDELPDAKRHGDDYSDSNDVVYQGEQFRGGQLEDSNSRSLQHNEESFGAEEDEEEDDGEEDDA